MRRPTDPDAPERSQETSRPRVSGHRLATVLILLAPSLAAGTAGAGDGPSPGPDRHIGPVQDSLRPQVARDARNRQTATGPWAEYLELKADLETRGLTFALAPTLISQWGSGKGAPAVQWLLSPSLDWALFTSRTLGKGSVQASYSWAGYSSAETGATLGTRLGMLSPPSNTATDTNIVETLTYTQVLPGDRVQVTAGQFDLNGFDNNRYANDEQTGFINNTLSWNASSTYSQAGLGAYVQVTPVPGLALAAGGQNAGNVSGTSVELGSVGTGPWAWFAYAQWTPHFAGLGSAQYSLLYYEQPSVPAQPGRTTGWSLNMVQDLDDTWGLFARVNASTGSVAEIERSVALGVVANDPLGRDPDDQAGIGLAWNRTNAAAFPGQELRGSETALEAYWNLTVGQAFQVGPDIQVVFDPARDPGSGPRAVVALRLNGLF